MSENARFEAEIDTTENARFELKAPEEPIQEWDVMVDMGEEKIESTFIDGPLSRKRLALLWSDIHDDD